LPGFQNERLPGELSSFVVSKVLDKVDNSIARVEIPNELAPRKVAKVSLASLPMILAREDFFLGDVLGVFGYWVQGGFL
tara:strand:+ start:17755 stop:17991 length:237 start_codon:yes stop_codon:yes gene_type:complete